MLKAAVRVEVTAEVVKIMTNHLKTQTLQTLQTLEIMVTMIAETMVEMAMVAAETMAVDNDNNF
jgi:hypothetical protein